MLTSKLNLVGYINFRQPHQAFLVPFQSTGSFPNVEYSLQNYTTGHLWDLMLIIWQLAELQMGATPPWKHRMPTWISYWHLKIVYVGVCKHQYMISYITLPIYTVGDIHALSEHIIFPKRGKVYDLNLYREENTSETLILIRILLSIF